MAAGAVSENPLNNQHSSRRATRLRHEASSSREPGREAAWRSNGETRCRADNLRLFLCADHGSRLAGVPGDRADARFKAEPADRGFQGEVVAAGALELGDDLDQAAGAAEVMAVKRVQQKSSRASSRAISARMCASSAAWQTARKL